jgi:hypothetical protein
MYLTILAANPNFDEAVTLALIATLEKFLPLDAEAAEMRSAFDGAKASFFSSLN